MTRLWVFLPLVLAACGVLVTDDEVADVLDQDRDGVQVGEDCDDDDPFVRPGAPEWCNGTDDDCDGRVDPPEAVASVPWWADGDGDGFGRGRRVMSCERPAGHARLPGDCDDAEPAVRPGAVERCNGIDDDCDRRVDDADDPIDGTTRWWRDADGDGVGAGAPVEACDPSDRFVARDGDCDDRDPDVRPGVPEVCNGGVDDDCDGLADDAAPAVAGRSDWFADADSDGFGAGAPVSACVAPAGRVAADGDCDDGAAAVRPGVAETCNGVDDDCSGAADDGLARAPWFEDGDGDGFGNGAAPAVDACGPVPGRVPDGADCDDAAAAVHPGAAERCGGSDEDCDGLRDDADPSVTDAPATFVDGDGDGHGAGAPVLSCDPRDRVAAGDDCDDADAARHPGRAEECNGVDDDCAGGVDDGLPQRTWFVDGDGDGFGDAGRPTFEDCGPLPGTVDRGGDCDDGASEVNPGAVESCNDVDDDCSGVADDGLATTDWYADTDGDGYGAGAAVADCAQLAGRVDSSSDCDDGLPGVNPGAAESCNDVDDDCSGVADDGLATTDWYADTDGDGYGAGIPVADCAQPPGRIADGTDCDDGLPGVNPGAAESCNGVDDDCSGVADDGLATTDWYADTDGDGYGAGAAVADCAQPPGRIADGTDCDDGLPVVNPGAAESCNGVDDDCSGVADDGLATTDWYADTDGDGYGAGAAVADCAQPPGRIADGTDCDDGLPGVNPGAAESCNDVDDDCSGLADDGLPTSDWYADTDGDGYGAGSAVADCAQPPGRVDSSSDCDDADLSVNPGATESCNDVDDDCSGVVDDGLATTNWYEDSDGDGYGAGAAVADCGPPAGRIADGTDCDDAASEVNPGAVESCNGVDDDCTGAADEGLATSWYVDGDGDGYGAGAAVADCAQPAGRVASSSDCDDADQSVNPGAAESCNDVDDDCSGVADDGLATTNWYSDTDGDGYGAGVGVADCAPPPGRVDASTDCDDSDVSVNPGATETCNGVDDDCSGAADEGLATSWYSDADADGYGAGVPASACVQPPGTTATRGDCDDALPAVNPGAVESCNDVDDDCSGVADDGLPTTDWYTDGDGDGYGAGSAVADCAQPPGRVDSSSDCDDGDLLVNPGAVESCNDVDDDCSGVADDGLATTDWYADGDGDGYGAGSAVANCAQPAGTTSAAGDCDDGDLLVNPGAVESCNDVDDDCSGVADDGLATTDWYADGDGDGYGAGSAVANCAQPAGTTSAAGDCDDGDLLVNPGAVESCNDVDDDCSGVADDGLATTDWYADGDTDGYGAGTPVSACAQPAGHVADGTDCDDALSAVNPGELESCNGVDDDCSGVADDGLATTDWYADSDGDGYGAGSAVADCAQPPGRVDSSSDCDDADLSVNPGAVESCNDVDDDCSGVADDGLATTDWYADSDGDGYGAGSSVADCAQPVGRIADGTDCDDAQSAVNPGEIESCNGVDDDCSGVADDGLATTDWYADTDGDGYGAGSAVADCAQPVGRIADGTDCDDGAPGVNPGATESCNGVDDDCSGAVDEGLATSWYADADADGYGAGAPASACAQPPGTTATAGDCDDGDLAVNPGATESCNDVDDDCSGVADDGLATTDWYADTDGDGYGAGSAVADCGQPPGRVDSSSDCDDGDLSVNPGAAESCNDVDDDCSGVADDGLATTDWYADTDSDGYGTGTAVTDCAQPAGTSATAGDCDDDLPAVNPGAAESCNDVDDDCSGVADDGLATTDWYADTDGDAYGAGSAVVDCAQPAGRISDGTDCDDGAPGVNPGATESCNDVDDDCSGVADDGLATTDWYADSDGDGYGAGSAVADCAQPPGRVDSSSDCDDADLSVNPGAVESCNDVDDDCSGVADDGLATTDWYADSDGDGYGAGSAVADCAQPPGRVDSSSDCDDADLSVNPGAVESCNDVDDDCSGVADDGLATTDWYADSDGDGYGAGSSVADCAQPVGRIADGTDCDDGAPGVNPGATESCNDVDDDCSGVADDGLATTDWYADGDGDGYGTGTPVTDCAQPAGTTATAGDCDDADLSVNPGAVESCNDVDDDCSGVADDGLATTDWYADSDGDGYGAGSAVADCAQPPGRVDSSSDCDDADLSVNPGAVESCNDVDDDCSGVADDGLVTTDWYADSDGDGYGAGSSVADCAQPVGRIADGTDCDDAQSAVNPGEIESCNGVDDDCSGVADDGLATTDWYADGDTDGYGAGTPVSACAQPAGHVADGTDCDDALSAVNPGELESCNGVDDDCSGVADDGLATTDWYADGDGDGYGAGSAVADCAQPPGRVDSSSDCDDADLSVNPGAVESCNDVDDDCSGVADDGLVTTDWYADSDGDGYGAGTPLAACAQPAWHVADGTDCDDAQSAVNPGEIESCNDVDDDCSGVADDGLVTTDWYADSDGDGYGAGSSVADCAQPVGRIADGTDCDDAQSAVNPGEIESCNGVDDDCSGVADDGLATTDWYADGDTDGYGAGTPLAACSQPAGYVADGADCDDALSAVNPGEIESCNDVDDDCSGVADDGLATTDWYADGDTDGYGAGTPLAACAQPAGHVADGTDCDDTLSAVNPGEAETCNGVDDDCSGIADDGLATTDWYADGDTDGYGAGTPLAACAQPAGHVADGTDCDDTLSAVNPGEAETCNDVDDDCSGVADDGLATTDWYADSDGDGYGAGSAVADCAQPPGRVDSSSDCDDALSAVNPGESETCNDVDDDCSGVADDGLATTDWYTDSDGDGYGTGTAVTDCAQPAGTTATAGDCDDGLPAVNPGATESCNDVDDDCSGVADDGLATTDWYADGDGDGYGAGSAVAACAQPVGRIADGTDCDDGAPGVNPGATESCNDVDDDCSGVADDGLATTDWYADTDGDGYGAGSAVADCAQPVGRIADGTDCDDGAPGVNPGATESCNDVDDDCSGGADDGLATTDWYADTDGDGYGAGAAVADCAQPVGRIADGTDCDDGAAGVNPGATESCNDVDDDCSGVADDGLATTDWYTDSDSDGYGTGTPVTDCAQPAGTAATAGDCDDGLPAVNPGATESCNDVDDDCSGVADDGLATTDWYADSDGDGYGTGTSVADCAQPAGRVDSSSDCDDADLSVNPGAVESCNGVDDDCSGVADDGLATTDWYTDSDTDGYGAGTPLAACAQPAGHVADGTDCDDTLSAVNPGEAETCNDVDDDCSGVADDGLATTDWYADGDTDGYGAGTPLAACSQPAGYVADGADCDDALSAVNPGEIESCNGVDDDCSGVADDGLATTDWYADGDTDGYGAGTPLAACAQPAGHVADGTDCDDTLSAVNPGEAETCNGVDDDCSGVADDGLATTDWYADGDTDGYGAGTHLSACSQPAGYVADGADCDDAQSAVNPGEIESCNGVDDDCSGVADDGLATTDWYADGDGDGYGAGSAVAACAQPVGRIADGTDCDDGAPGVNPGATESCNDVDDDCSGVADDGLATTDWYADSDGDGYGTGTSVADCAQPPGRVDSSSDCDDADLSVNPGAVESCNGVDDDCSGVADDGLATTDWYTDSDTDGYGAGTPLAACAQPAGHVADGTDCDDTLSAVNPGEAETCNGVDDDCSGVADDGLATTDWYADGDTDGYGAGTPLAACAQPAGYVADGADCDDALSAVNPGEIESCNGVDDDCSGVADDGLATTDWYADGDTDGYGAGTPLAACAQPAGHVADGTDCDDTLSAVNPGEAETCNGVDDDCSGVADDGLATTDWYADGDTDGYGAGTHLSACSQPAGYVADGADCDDAQSAVNPGEIESCNGVDDDCSGVADDGLATTDWYADTDGDGYGAGSSVADCAQPVGRIADGTDCDDGAPGVNPGATESCNDIDDDCSGVADDGLATTDWYADGDGDGYGAGSAVADCAQPVGRIADGTDCDDGAPGVNPGATESCNDVDDDCSGVADDGLATTDWYADSDGDGYGTGTSVADCAQPPGRVDSSSDCDDADLSVNPGAVESCNGVDDDCSGVADDGLATTDWYTDSDTDGYGAGTPLAACAQPAGHVADGTDCDDTLSAVNPGEAETCNGVDDDCSGVADDGLATTDWYADGDTDGYGAGTPLAACAQPAGYVADGADCDDALSAVNPGEIESCNGVDDDCSGVADDGLATTDWYADSDGDGYGAGSAVADCAQPVGRIADGTDCDDGAPGVNPGATESCNDVDDDCSGVADDGLATTDWYADSDGDGYGTGTSVADCAQPPGRVDSSSDCDDADLSVNPGAVESCNGVDDDCSGVADDGLATTDWYTDSDTDGYGAGTPLAACAQPAGHVADGTDCDDTLSAVNPGEAETCNGVDDDCSGVADDGLATTDWYADGDTDGYGAGTPLAACAQPAGYVADGADCDDALSAVNPGEIESCNGVDDDCSGVADDGLATTDWYADGDTDGYGAGTPLAACAQPAGHVADGTDCDDTLSAVNPGEAETCNGVDDDCSGVADDGLATTDWYADGDTDGYGAGTHLSACSQPAGYVADGADCDDAQSAVNPGEIESCNGVDDDCSGVADDGLATTDWYADTDGDGYGAGSSVADCAQPVGRIADGTDCDDGAPGVNPGATESCNDIDDDCSGVADDGLATTDWYADGDGDGYGAGSAVADCAQPVGRIADGTDCDDGAPGVNPGATESCNDVDDDCSGVADDGLATTDWYADSDGDGYGTGTSVADCAQPPGRVDSSSDCDDADLSVNPGAVESCNGVDDDCSGVADDGLATTDWYTDSDTDGYGAGTPLAACAQPAGHVADGTDCDDTLSAVNPGEAETCNGVDDDCSGVADDGLATTDWYADGDGDGYGAGSAVAACAQPVGRIADGTDCDDGAPGVNPGATESCNDLDDDCSGVADDGLATTDWYTDSDSDGYGTGTPVTDCAQPAGTAGTAGDCDDGLPAVNPGATESCNDVDDDCSGVADDGLATTDWYADTDGDGYGTGTAVTDCAQPAGTSATAGDCDDGLPAVNPGATESCNDVDDDCSGVADDGLATTDWYTDSDSDGYGTGTAVTDCAQPAGTTATAGDCDDGLPAVNPGATESCNDVDDDCSGVADDGLATTDWYADTDGDGYGAGSAVADCAQPPGRVDSSSDCDDGDLSVNPGATESCNDLDDDCSGVADDGLATTDWYADTDGDGYGAGAAVADCAQPVGRIADGTDCNDGAAGVNPGATESCNDVDDDCSGVPDDGLATTDWYADSDGDGYGTGTPVTDCAQPAGTTATAGDCDDGLPAVNPGEAETCNGVDDDCSGVADDGLATTDWYADGDTDGYGAGTPLAACAQPAGHVADGTDCDDALSAVNPGEIESCNGVDDDCSGVADDGLATTDWYTDSDGDGYGTGTAVTDCAQPVGTTATAGDCDDGLPAVNPGATESCNDVDDDCSGVADDGLATTDWYTDSDGDGYGTGTPVTDCAQPAGTTATAGDCDDGLPAVNPAATESCNGVDDDCSGVADDGLATTDWYADSDGDGYGIGTPVTDCAQPAGTTATAGDCDDGLPAVNPAATESCNDVDDDCTGVADDGLATTDWYTDSDGDGYGTGTPVTDCAQPAGTSAPAGDCDDGLPAVNPGATESCNDVDDDCTGVADDGLATTDWYTDSDGDGYGTGTPVTDCAQPAGTSATAGDCDDGLPAVNPGATESCNDVDDDCTGVADDGLATTDWYTDSDGDGYGTGTPVTDCAQPAGTSATAGDCDDGLPAVNPGATESCNGVDDDCSGVADDGLATTDWYADSDGDGYGTGAPILACAQPPDTAPVPDDCDDASPSVHPGATEQCNGVDDDCDEVADNGVVDVTWYADFDGDGFGGIGGPTVQACAQPPLYVATEDDCDDAEPAVNPAAVEICDGLDDDCDGFVDGADPEGTVGGDVPWYLDDDADGYGLDGDSVLACDQPAGRALRAGDCDDAAPGVNPGAYDDCNGLDEDCDGTADDDGILSWYVDADGDLAGDPATEQLGCDRPVDMVGRGDDCDDADPTRAPTLPEACGNGVDDDCDGVVDQGAMRGFEADVDLASAWATVSSAFDGEPSAALGAADGGCSSPGAPKVWAPLSGPPYQRLRVEFGAEMIPWMAEVYTSAAATVTSAELMDASGTVIETSTTVIPSATCGEPHVLIFERGRCAWLDDTFCAATYDPDVRTAALMITVEVADEDLGVDGVDAVRLVGNVPSGTPSIAVDPYGTDLPFTSILPWPPADWRHPDGDGDGFGDRYQLATVCGAPTDWVAAGGDCDDADDTLSPGSVEQCTNGIDDDCDQLVDAGDPDPLGDVDTRTVDVAQFAGAASADSEGPGTTDGGLASAAAGATDDGGCDTGPASWSPADAADEHTLELLFAQPVYASVVRLWAPYLDGALTLTLLDTTGAPVDTQVSPAITLCGNDPFQFDFARSTALVDRVWVTVGAGTGVAIDAVELLGTTDADLALDEDLFLAGSRWFADGDGDLAGSGPVLVATCGQPDGATWHAVDCDDADPAISPLNNESCDGLDEDCDGGVDEGADVLDPAFLDADGDGYGDINQVAFVCATGDYVANSDDCDDTDASVSPAEPEHCGDGVDDDCDGLVDGDDSVDPGELLDFWPDLDADGYGDDTGVPSLACTQPVLSSVTAGDCDDSEPAVFPSAVEDCSNGIDDDCDTLVDAADPGHVEPTWYADDDGDGYGIGAPIAVTCGPVADASTTAGDCDDAAASVNPGMTEVCSNGIDDDCDGYGCEPFGDFAADLAHGTRISNTVAPRMSLGTDLAIGDLSGDGVPDLAAGTTNSVMVINGPFARGVDLPVFDHYDGARAGFSGDSYGSFLAPVLDYDGDGQDDVLTIARAREYGLNPPGKAIVILGPVQGTTATPTLEAIGEDAGDGASVQFGAVDAGDFDGDGAPEALVGVALHSGPYGSSGAVYVFAPGIPSLGDASTILYGDGGFEFAGAAVGSLGDLDGDGLDDFAVGTLSGTTDAPSYVFYGPPPAIGAMADADLVWTGTMGQYPNAYEAVGDVDGDGYGDAAVAVQSASTVYLLRGGPAATSGALATVAWATLSTVDVTYAGTAIAAGDFDADGLGDLAVGAQYWNTDGQVAIVYAPSAGAFDLTAADALVAPDTDDHGFGVSLVAGDLDGDGIDDLAIGSTGTSPPGASEAGAVYLLFGGEL